MRTRKSQPLPYAERLSIAATEPLRAAVAEAADRTMTSMNSYVRAAILAQLRKDGVRLRDVEDAASMTANRHQSAGV
jgi:hypothetical protein